MSKVLPRTIPKKVSELAGFPVNVIWLPDIVNALIGCCTTPETDIITDASVSGDTAVPLTVRLNGPAVDPVNDPDISSKI
jgi:hypothetical protein